MSSQQPLSVGRVQDHQHPQKSPWAQDAGDEEGERGWSSPQRGGQAGPARWRGQRQKSWSHCPEGKPPKVGSSKWYFQNVVKSQITKALRRPVLVSISPEVIRASIVPDSEEFSSCFVTRLSLATPAIVSSILLSSKTPDQLIELKPSLLPPTPSVDWPALIKSCATSEKQLICSCPRPASYLTCTSPNFPFFSSRIVLDWICNQNKLKLAVKSWFTAGPCSWRQVRVVEPAQTLHLLVSYR